MSVEQVAQVLDARKLALSEAAMSDDSKNLLGLVSTSDLELVWSRSALEIAILLIVDSVVI
jgi:hypothetical protein